MDGVAAELLAGFVPAYRRIALQEASRSGRPSVQARLGALLFVDIVGFTTLTDRMAEMGMVGSERLAELIDRYLGGMSDLAGRFAGEITMLAGDAVAIVWFADDQSGLADAALRATECGLAIQEFARDWSADGSSIRFRASIGSGALRHFEVGGRSDEWHAVLSGPALAAATGLLDRVDPGRLALAPSVVETVRPFVRLSHGENGMAIVERVTRTSPAQAGARQPPSKAPFTIPVGSVPPLIRDRLRSLDPSWRGEFRTVTAVFTVLRQVEYDRAEDALASRQEAVARVQAVVAALDGNVHQIRADKEGLIITSVFGLPPQAHEDDSLRAVETALTLHREWGRLGLTASAGIATGKVFCAIVGSPPGIRVFTLVGPVMNLAARLMQLGAGVVCDKATINSGRTSRRIDSRRLTPQSIKGKANNVEAFVPLGIVGVDRANQPAIVGRAEELAVLDDAVATVRAGRGHTLFIDGEAGIGKSTLVEGLLKRAGSAGLRSMVGHANEMDRAAFAALRPVLRTLFEIPDSMIGSSADVLSGVVKILGPDADMGPLIGDALGVQLTDSPTTLRLTNDLRAATLKRLLLARLKVAAEMGPILICVEDVHWLDSASFGFVLEVADANLPLLLAVTGRDFGERSEEVERLSSQTNCRRMRLKGFDRPGAAEYVAALTNTDLVKSEVVDLVIEQSAGNPLFISEIARVLVEARIATIADGVLQLRSMDALAREGINRELGSAGASATIEGIIVARFDRLPATRRALLQAASVFGREFSEKELTTLFPSGSNAELPDDLDGLVADGYLIVRDERHLSYRHSVLREVIYGTLPFSERRRLHRIVAEIMETRTEGLEAAAPVLGFHFGEAGDLGKSIHYLQLGAERALRGYATIEAISLAHSAIERIQDARRAGLPLKGVSVRPDAFHLILGRGYHRLSRYREAREHAEAGLRGLGFGVPASSTGVIAGTVREILLQLACRKVPALIPSFGKTRREKAIEAASSLEYLVDIYFFSDQPVRAAYAAVRMLNLSERSGYPDGSALGFVSFAGMAAAAGLSGVAARYRERAIGELARVTDLHATIWVPYLVGATLVGTGDWSGASRFLDQASSAASEANDYRSWVAAAEMLGVIAACQGNWPDALAHAEAVRGRSSHEKDRRAEVAALRELAYYQIQSGQRLDASDTLERIRVELERGLTAETETTRMELSAMMAAVRLADGRLPEARTNADAALAAILATRLGFPNSYWAMFLVAHVFLSLWQGTTSEAERNALRQASRQACKALGRQVRSFGIAKPATLLAWGGYEYLAGRERHARRYWTRCVGESGRLGMGYEAAAAELAMAGLLGNAASAQPLAGVPLFAGLGVARPPESAAK